MENGAEIQNDKLYEIARLNVRNNVDDTAIIQLLMKEGSTERQAKSILNTSSYLKRSTIKESRFLLVVCSSLFIISILGFLLIPSGHGAGIINYILFTLAITAPLVISYAVNHSIVSLEMKKMQSTLYVGFIIYLVLMLVYLTYYKFSQDRSIWEALLFVFIAYDFRNLYRASDDKNIDNAEDYLEIKAYQGEQKKYRIFKRITYSSSVILIYMMLISSSNALAGISYFPFGVAVIAFYWVVMSLIEMNDYKKLI